MKYRKIATEIIDTTVYNLFFFNFGKKWAKFQLKGRKAQYSILPGRFGDGHSRSGS